MMIKISLFIQLLAFILPISAFAGAPPDNALGNCIGGGSTYYDVSGAYCLSTRTPSGHNWTTDNGTSFYYSRGGYNTGYFAVTGTAPPPVTCTEGEQLADQYLLLPASQALLSSGDCQVRVTGCGPAQSVVADGVDTQFALCQMVLTGSPLEDVPNPELIPLPNLPDNTCKANQSGGTFNDQFICINNSDGKIASTVPPKVTTTGETATDVDNGDGTTTKTTIKTTINENGDAYHTVNKIISDNGTGEVISNETTTTDENPEPDSSFADNGCGSPPSCTGDALQCAIASQSFKTACLLTPPDPSELTAAALGIPVEDREIGEPTIIDVDGEIDTSSFLTSACPSPRSINVLGTSIVLDYEPFCEIAEIVGNFVLIGAALVSIKIIGGV
jgi:hypothetical protein